MPNDPIVKAKLDRIIFASKAKHTLLPPIPGFNTKWDFDLRYARTPIVGANENRDKWQRLYRRYRYLVNPTTGSLLEIWHQRLQPYIDNIKICLIASDDLPITIPEIRTLWTLFAPSRLVTFELAFDFDFDATVDRTFVRRHGKFGKARVLKRPNLGAGLYWGERKSSKLVRAYFKEELDKYRVELELHSRLIRKLRMEHFCSITDLCDLLLPRHIQFVRIDWARVKKYCERHGIEAGIIALAKRKPFVSYKLGVLRNAGVMNPYRFLVPLKKNIYVRQALAAFVDQYRDLARLAANSATSTTTPPFFPSTTESDYQEQIENE